MNALAAVDKLDPKECLLAENVRFDETGNIQSAGAYTHQNGTAYNASGGQNVSNIHSLYWNPSLGGVAGVGQDVFIGPTLGGLANKLIGKNTINQKMSFASAPNRVYFDVGSVGYWTDMVNLLTVDWVPPTAFSPPSLGGPSAPVTVSTSGSGWPWSTPSGLVGTSSSSPAVVNPQGYSTLTSQRISATMGTSSFSIPSTSTVVGIQITMQVQEGNQLRTAGDMLTVYILKAGVPVGSSRVVNINPSSGFNLVTFGGPVDLWGATWLPAEVNAGTFGFQLVVQNSGPPQTSLFSAYNAQVQVYGAATGFTSAAGTTGTLTGTYSYKMTFVAANGEESDASYDTLLTTLSGQQGTLTAIPTGDARTVARNVYRKGYATSTPLTLHYLVGTIQDNSSTTYSDNQTDIAALTAGIILAGDVPGDSPNTRLNSITPSVRFPAYHYDRVFWINQQQKNQIIWSKPLNGFAYPVVNFANVGDSTPISRIVSIFGELIIIKQNGQIWRLTGTDESSFDLTQTPSAVGTDQSFTVVILPDKILFANRYGFWVFNGYTSQPLTPKLDLWFKQEDRSGKSLFGANGFHPPEVFSATVPLNFDAVGNTEKMYFAYAEAGQAQNNALLTFDVKHGNLTKREPGAPLPLSLAIDPVTGFVYMGDNRGFISLLDDWNGANGGGSPINFDFQHGYQDFQRGSNKRVPALEFYINTNGQSITPTVYYDNGAANEVLAPITTTSLQRVLRTLQATNSRKAQNISVRLNGSINPVNVSGTPQIQVVHIKVYYDVYTGRPRTGQ